MKRINISILIIIFTAAFFKPCMAYHIEVLQVAKIAAFEESYQGFLNALKTNGIIEGHNLTIKRHIIDADADAGLWKKIGILMKIKKTASEIVRAKPDLVLTISTPATKYSMDKFISAGIPLVFSSVAIPELVGCKSKTEPGRGFTGATIYMDPNDLLSIMKATLPELKTVGIVHSDDDNARAFTKEASEKAKAMGLSISAIEIGKSDKITPSCKKLAEKGVGAFLIPIDAYYALRDYEGAWDISKVSFDTKIPIFSSVVSHVPGPLLYIAPDFYVVGSLAGDHASKILKDGILPEMLPVARQSDLNLLFNLDVAKNIEVEVPIEILQAAKNFSKTKYAITPEGCKKTGEE